MDRREFLASAGAGMSVLQNQVGVPTAKTRRATREMKADVVIIGGGVGGCAAAMAAARNGRRVIMTEETDWIGGQFTSQAVPPDEHRYIEQFGATRSYRQFRTEIREYYRRYYPLTNEARGRWNLNPGGCRVSHLCFEPKVGLAALEAMLAPYMSGSRITLLTEHKSIAATANRDRIEAVRVRDLRDGREIDLSAPIFLDATELGDLLPMSGTEYVTGAESKAQTGELHAPPEPQPLNIQCLTWCFVIDHVEGENHTIEKPAEYDLWREYESPEPMYRWALTKPKRTYRLDFSFDSPPRLPPTGCFNPVKGDCQPMQGWLYRRMIDRRNFEPGTFRGDVCLINWDKNDFWHGNIIEVSEQEAKRNLARARQLSLSLLYWLQTEAVREDGGKGWPGLRPRGDIAGTRDGLAKYPYIRESRRIKAEFTVLEHHVGVEARMQATGVARRNLAAESFFDSVGIGLYGMDRHDSTGGDTGIGISSLPFEIPMGSLIPVRVENLLASGKNLGVTHITNGCYRLHPVEWNVGESSGMLAAYCLEKKATPRQVRNKPALLEDFQRLVQSQGVEIRWPRPIGVNY